MSSGLRGSRLKRTCFVFWGKCCFNVWNLHSWTQSHISHLFMHHHSSLLLLLIYSLMSAAYSMNVYTSLKKKKKNTPNLTDRRWRDFYKTIFILTNQNGYFHVLKYFSFFVFLFFLSSFSCWELNVYDSFLLLCDSWAKGWLKTEDMLLLLLSRLSLSFAQVLAELIFLPRLRLHHPALLTFDLISSSGGEALTTQRHFDGFRSVQKDFSRKFFLVMTFEFWLLIVGLTWVSFFFHRLIFFQISRSHPSSNWQLTSVDANQQ